MNFDSYYVYIMCSMLNTQEIWKSLPPDLKGRTKGMFVFHSDFLWCILEIAL